MGKALKAAFPITLPVLAGYLVLGFGFGLLLNSKGYGPQWALLMCLLTYSGSMQYAACDLLASGASLISCAVITLIINARHLFYGLSLLTRYKNMGKAKPYLMFGLTDETFSLTVSNDVPNGQSPRYFYFAITLLDQIYWIIGGLIGNIFGTLVPLNTKGVDFSMTALFIVIVLSNLLKKKTRLSSVIGLACAMICLVIFGPENFLIPSMVVRAVVLIAARPLITKVIGDEREDAADPAPVSNKEEARCDAD